MKSRNLLPIAIGIAVALASAPAWAGAAPFGAAVVDPDGTLSRGLHAVSAARLNTGAYEVIFSKDVTACAYTASIGLSGSSGVSNPGVVTVAQRASNPNGVFVETFNTSQVSADLGFHLIVTCK